MLRLKKTHEKYFAPPPSHLTIARIISFRMSDPRGLPGVLVTCVQGRESQALAESMDVLLEVRHDTR